MTTKKAVVVTKVSHHKKLSVKPAPPVKPAPTNEPPTPFQQKTQVDTQLHGLEKRLETIGHEIEALHSRISGILLPPVPKPGAPEKAPVSTVGLAKRLEQIGLRLDSISSYLVELRFRVDL